MGWLELLALLKRVLPLLDRLAPVLESAVASRFTGKAEAERVSAAALAAVTAEAERASRVALAEVARSHGSVLQALEDQRAQAQVLAGGLQQIKIANDAIAARLNTRSEAVDVLLQTLPTRLAVVERQNTSLLHLLRGGLAVLFVLLVAVLFLLYLLLRRHS